MPATAQLINGVAIALELPLMPRWLEEVSYNLNYVESGAGPEIFDQIQTLVDAILEADEKMTTLASDGQGLMIRADVIEWQAGGQLSGLQSELARLRAKLARLLMLDHLLGNCKTVSLVRW